jgi:hypothetical protein
MDGPDEPGHDGEGKPPPELFMVSPAPFVIIRPSLLAKVRVIHESDRLASLYEWTMDGPDRAGP